MDTHADYRNREADGLPVRAWLILMISLCALLPAAVTADNYVGGIPLTTVKSGTVSGGLYVDAGNTWWPATPGPQVVQKTFASIPNVNNIQWARLYVSVYCGHMQNNYQGAVTTSFDGNGDGTFETVLGTENLNVAYSFPNDGGSGPVIINDHLNRVTSDYLMWYNVTTAISSQTPKTRVVTSAISGSFDGRIKLITLVVAYNDGDSDTVHYWVNQGHDTDTYYAGSDYTGMTEFDLARFTGTAESATLTVNHMASEDGSYSWLGDPLPTDPPGGNWQGAYFGYNIWDVTSLVRAGEICDLAFDRTDQFYKIPLAVLTIRQSPLVIPVADFSADPLSGETPLSVRFTDLSAGPPSSWKWEYRFRPEGGSSYGAFTPFATDRNPVYTFSAVGTYTVQLTATNTLGTNTRTKIGYITVTQAPPPVAAFSATPLSGPAPLAVTFTDQSTGSGTSWKWAYKNATVGWTQFSTAKSPSFTFPAAGTYDINLTATNTAGSDDELKTGYITITQATTPVAAFSATPLSGPAPLAVTFTDQSTGIITSYAWDFTSDGTVDSTAKNTSFIYTVNGNYTARLTVNGPGGSNSTTTSIMVSAVPAKLPAPDANFTADLTRGSAPLTVRFSDKSTGSVMSWAWDFSNDGVTDRIEQNPSYTFTDIGVYTVKLTVMGPGGSDTEQKTDYIRVRGTPDCDLTIAGAVNPVASTVFAREPNTIRVVNVRNNGPKTSPTTSIRLTASDGFTTTGQVSALASGQNTTILLTDATVRASAGAAVTYTVTVDPEDDVAETDETNNVKQSTAKTVTYNGYKGKRYWDGGDITTRRTFDLHGGLVHSFGDSVYHSGVFGGSGWTSYTVTWTESDLSLPSNATVRKAILYVPYTWDNSNTADTIAIRFNGESISRGGFYKDRSNFGAYADYDYGLQTYDVTTSFKKNAQNTATFSRGSADAKLSMYGFTLAVIYEEPDAPRSLIFINEGFDLLGADEDGYGTTPEEATAYVPFSGLTVPPAQVSGADLITFVASGDSEGALLFNGNSLGSGVWDYGSVSGTQVAVDTRDVTSAVSASGNYAMIQSTPGATPAMEAIQQFLVVRLGAGTLNLNPVYNSLYANFSAEPLNGSAPLTVNFTDLSGGNPTGWKWDFDYDGIIDNTTQHPANTYLVPGNYTVNLTVNNATSSVTLSKIGYILVTNTTAPTTEPTPTPETVTTVPTSDEVTREQTLSTDAVPATSGTAVPDPQPESNGILSEIMHLLSDVASAITGGIQTMLHWLPFTGAWGIPHDLR